MPDPDYWYSLIAASPNPENEEAANVAVVVGNGLATRLVYSNELPRLCGVATSADTAVFRTILQSLADRVNQGIDRAELQALLGPQLRIMRSRALYREPTDEVLARLRKQFLEKPRGQGDEAAAKALVRRSTNALDSVLRRSAPRGVELTEKATPRRLYERRLDTHVGFQVPRIARAVRFAERDVLIDSVLVERETAGRPLSIATSRVSQAFFAYNQLRSTIRQYANRDVILIGVIHPGSTEDANMLQRREWVKHTWRPDSDVIDGNEVDVEAALHDKLEALHR
jgi:septum formation inhibitor MinC